jgi:hypothetical protein
MKRYQAQLVGYLRISADTTVRIALRAGGGPKFLPASGFPRAGAAGGPALAGPAAAHGDTSAGSLSASRRMSSAASLGRQVPRPPSDCLLGPPQWGAVTPPR